MGGQDAFSHYTAQATRRELSAGAIATSLSPICSTQCRARLCRRETWDWPAADAHRQHGAEHTQWAFVPLLPPPICHDEKSRGVTGKPHGT